MMILASTEAGFVMGARLAMHRLGFRAITPGVRSSGLDFTIGFPRRAAGASNLAGK
jgi:hypothetical protein